MDRKKGKKDCKENGKSTKSTQKDAYIHTDRFIIMIYWLIFVILNVKLMRRIEGFSQE